MALASPRTEPAAPREDQADDRRRSGGDRHSEHHHARADGFGFIYHRQVTEVGLGPGQGFSFLRVAVLGDITDEHEWMDAGFPSYRVGEDEKHVDDCEFDGAAQFINDRYAVAGAALSSFNVWGVTDAFGRLLHTVQDFYSHSNWVELGFPRTPDDPSTPVAEVSQSDLVDLSGAQSSLSRSWFAPAGGAVVRGDILLGGDDWEGIPHEWTIDRNGPALFVPTLIDPQGSTRGRLLETGKGTGDSECGVPFSDLPLGVAYTGISHDHLNKDSPSSGDPSLSLAERQAKHEKARALAILQTGYEWCRLVRQARLRDP